MTRILSFRPDVVSNGTAFEAMALIYKYLQEHHGYRFTVIKSEEDEYYDRDFEIVSIPAISFKSPFIPISLKGLSGRNCRYLFQAADGILTVDPTVYRQGSIAISEASLQKKPVWFDTSLTILGDTSSFDWKIKRHFSLRKIINQTTGIIATVPKCLERFRDLGLLDQETASKFNIVGHPVDINQFSPRSKLSERDKILRVLVVSRMIPEKGILYILEAMTPILKAREDVQLQLLGSGLLRPLLEQEVVNRQLSDKVTFLDPVPHEKLPHILAAADVFINHAITTGSWEEYFGAANLEAMACELPCVLTRCGGIPYAIREKDVAIFVSERDIVQLREAITQLLDSEQKRSEISKQARSYVEEHYALPLIANKYHRMLQHGFSQRACV